MSATHTPGPWFIEAGAARIITTKALHIVSADDGLGPVAYGTLDNARLIAAAPDLLEAVQGLLGALPSATSHPAIAAARAAIAKAGGAA